jgi:ABC-type Fe3+-hydroxamate transport system substrate-binding protein
MIDVAAERNPDKYGARTLGTDIPIVSEEESRAMNPDYYLVLPWHFRDEFLRRERATLERGVGMIFPLPSVEVVRA